MEKEQQNQRKKAKGREGFLGNCPRAEKSWMGRTMQNLLARFIEEEYLRFWLGDCDSMLRRFIDPTVSADRRTWFLPMTRSRFHTLMASILLVCLLCPFVEMALDWNDSIFVTGYDTESTIAVLLLILGLALALTTLLVIVLPVLLEKERLVASHRLLRFNSGFVITLPEVSPPLPLRI